MNDHLARTNKQLRHTRQREMRLRQPDNLFRSGNFPSHICDRPTLSLDRKLCNLPGELAASDSADIYRGYRFGFVLFSPPFSFIYLFFFCDPQTATMRITLIPSKRSSRFHADATTFCRKIRRTNLRTVRK